MSIDWSMHDGYSYVTSPRNQLFTNFCWGFAVTALIESMVRREHGAWCARSEGDLFFGLRYFTFLGGDPNAASDFVYENGLADPDCVPWFGTEANFAHPESGSADRAGRVVRAPRIQEVNGINTQIHWLHIIGPLIGSFDVFDDFGAFYFSGTGVYQPAATAINTGGNHVVMIVGVDEERQCWIAKNSWGATVSHPKALFRIAFGVANIDTFRKYGLVGTNPDPATKRRHHSGGLFVSGNGTVHRNLELIYNNGNQFRHYFKEPGNVWMHAGDFGANVFSPNSLLNSEVAATQTTFNRNFEVVARFEPPASGGPLQHWAFVQRLQQWACATPLGFGPRDSVGTPAFIQSNRGEPGDFEVIARTAGGGLAHWTRRNSRPWTTELGVWFEKSRFANGVVGDPALLQIRGGSSPRGEQGAGDLHVFFANANHIVEHWTFPMATQTWTRVQEFLGNVGDRVHVVEGLDGPDEWHSGTLELFALVGGSIERWSCGAPQHPSGHWTFSSRFGANLQEILGVAQGHQGVGWIDLLCRNVAGKVEHWALAQARTGKWIAFRAAVLP